MREKDLKLGMAENPILTLNPVSSAYIPTVWKRAKRADKDRTVDWRTEDDQAF